MFKGRDKIEKSNSRPISILPVISRLFERLVFNQLYQYLNENDFIHPNHSGFPQQRSTLICLLKITDDWDNGLDSGQMLGSVFNHLKKAFDTVDHDLLCKRLEHYSVQLSWFPFYLSSSNRKQYCRVRGGGCKTLE